MVFMGFFKAWQSVIVMIKMFLTSYSISRDTHSWMGYKKIFLVVNIIFCMEFTIRLYTCRHKHYTLSLTNLFSVGEMKIHLITFIPFLDTNWYVQCTYDVTTLLFIKPLYNEWMKSVKEALYQNYPKVLVEYEIVDILKIFNSKAEKFMNKHPISVHSLAIWHQC